MNETIQHVNEKFCDLKLDPQVADFDNSIEVKVVSLLPIIDKSSKMMETTKKTIFKNPFHAFTITQQGQSHLDKDIVCQDRSDMIIIQNKVLVSAIADGVGSCTYSQLGAQTAVQTSLEYIQNYFETENTSLEMNDNNMNEILKNAMNAALHAVEDKAKSMKLNIYDFQSTLTIAIYNGSQLYFSHAGDDGIVVLSNGMYEMVTQRHKGELANSVYPLQNVATWQFGKIKQDVQAFIMSTDGVLDSFVMNDFQKNRVYFPFIQPIIYNERTPKENCEFFDKYLSSPNFRKRVTDDITLLCVVNIEELDKDSMPKFDLEKWNEDTNEIIKQQKKALYGISEISLSSKKFRND